MEIDETNPKTGGARNRVARLIEATNYHAQYEALLTRALLHPLMDRNSTSSKMNKETSATPQILNPDDYAAEHLTTFIQNDLRKKEVRKGDLEAHSLAMKCIREKLEQQRDRALQDLFAQVVRQVKGTLPKDTAPSLEALRTTIEQIETWHSDEGFDDKPSAQITRELKRQLAQRASNDRRAADARNRTRRLSRQY